MKKIFLVLCLVVFAAVCNATSYYVDDTTGSDTYDGTVPLFDTGTIGPKLTITAGLTLLSAGDTLWIRWGATAYVPSALLSPADLDIIIKGYYQTANETTLIGDCDEGQPFYKDETFGYPVLDYGNAAYNGFSIIDLSGVRIFNLKME